MSRSQYGRTSLRSGARDWWINPSATIIFAGGRVGLALIPVTSIMLGNQSKRRQINISFLKSVSREIVTRLIGVNILTQIQFILKYVLLLKKHHLDEMITLFSQMLISFFILKKKLVILNKIRFGGSYGLCSVWYSLWPGASLVSSAFVGVLIVSWPSVGVCLVLGAFWSVCSSHMVVRTLGLRLSSGILG